MKLRIGSDVGSYAFNAASRTITFSGVAFTQDALLTVFNVTRSAELYSIADATKGGTLVGSVLTLTLDTTAMQNSDKLLIFVDSVQAQPVSASSLPLPSGASTESTLAALKAVADSLLTAAQSIQSAAQALNTKTTAVNTGAVAGTVGVSNFPALQPVSDNNGSLTVDGAVSVSNFPSTQQVSVSNWQAVQPVSDNGSSLTVDGSVSVSNFPSTQPVSAAALPLPTGASTEATLAALSAKVTEVDTDNVTVANQPQHLPMTPTRSSLQPNAATRDSQERIYSILEELTRQFRNVFRGQRSFAYDGSGYLRISGSASVSSVGYSYWGAAGSYYAWYNTSYGGTRIVDDREFQLANTRQVFEMHRARWTFS